MEKFRGTLHLQRPCYNTRIVFHFNSTKLLQKSEMRKDIVIELSYKGFS